MHKLKILPSVFLTLNLWAATPGLRDRAPDFTLSNLQGNPVRLSDELAKGPLVLVVLRGYPGYQCPLCNRQVREFIQHGAAFTDAGVRLLFVYPGPADKAADFMKDKSLPSNMTMVLDPAYEFTNLYGLRWDAPKETAYPSTFIIDKTGIVTFARISRTHGGRTSARELLDHVKR
jgi:peroxiredoxin Q/BCP